jgi:hypothetical protein
MRFFLSSAGKKAGGGWMKPHASIIARAIQGGFQLGRRKNENFAYKRMRK